MLERIDPEKAEAWVQELNEPFTGAGRDPDSVSQDVIDQEMALFNQARAVL